MLKDSYANSGGWQGYEGYNYYNAQGGSGNGGSSTDPYVYGSSWEAPKLGPSPSTAMSGEEGRPGGSGTQTDNPDSIIAKINQRLDLMSKESGDKDNQERFESFQSYVFPTDKEQQFSSPFQYGEEGSGANEGAGGSGASSGVMPSSEGSSPHGRGRAGGGVGGREPGASGGNRGRGGGIRDFRGGSRGGHHQQNRPQNRRGGFNHREGLPPPHHQHPHQHSHFSQPPGPYGRFTMPPNPHMHSPSSSERLSARWNELNYMGPRGCGPGGARGGRGRLPSLFPPSQPPYQDYPDSHGPPFPPHYPPSHGMMGGFYPPPGPFGAPRGGGAWQWNGKNWPRGDRDGRRPHGGPVPRSLEGRKRRYSQTLDDTDAHRPGADSEGDGNDSDQNPYSQNDEDETQPTEEGVGEEMEKSKTGSKEHDDDETKRKKERKKERQLKDHRLRFVCSVCKFRTVEEKEIKSHLEGRFHKEIFSFVATKIPEIQVKFLQDLAVQRYKKIMKRRQEMVDKDEAFEKSDPFVGAGRDEFCKRIEAAHCMACDMIIPAQHSLLQRHVSSEEHQRNREAITEQFKMTSVPIAKSILKGSNIRKMLDKYIKGEDPFTVDEGEPKTDQDATATTTGASEGLEEKGEEVGGVEPGIGLEQGTVTLQEGTEGDGNMEEVQGEVEEEEEEKGALGDSEKLLEEDLNEEDENPMA
uniref:A-kinase anchor protein 8-like n=1 Tax=Scleropages formosus TaxID=113540 RepID=A0A8C9R931_SCLFO